MFSVVFRRDGKVAVYWRRDLVCVISDKSTALMMLNTLVGEIEKEIYPDGTGIQEAGE